jgi:predicted cation transporter
MIALLLTLVTVAAVLLGPILVKPVERNIELFFLAAGIVAALVTGQLNSALVRNALREPLELSLAVLVFGVAFRLIRAQLDRLFAKAILCCSPLRSSHQ